jgi:AcrR family transcriptional regulator
VNRPSQRAVALDAALDLLRDGGVLSLEVAARAAGLTKPGLMYHFPTKEALVTGLVDHLLDTYAVEFRTHLRGAGETAAERIEAYLRWSLGRVHDAADLAFLADPRLREEMSERWATRLDSWLGVPADLPAPTRARLLAVRMMADGCWYADATGCVPLTPDERNDLLVVGLDLLEAS